MPESPGMMQRIIFMLQRMRFILFACMFISSAAAAPLAASAREEIDTLLSRLEASACNFNRNGTWYTAAEAKSHLLRKLKFLESRDEVQSTEQFIERAASGSSITGKPYLVICGNDAPVPSAAWLRAQLQSMRSPGQARSAP